jgi:alpha-N-arabinofuranosidase
VDLTARLVADGKNVSGTLQVHNLVVADFVSAHDAAYPLLTSSASTSSDGKKVYLIVFNKSAADSIPTDIHLTSFSPAGALYWEVNGPSLDSSTGVVITQKGAPLSTSKANTATHVFPAHSMTAIEFSNAR